MSGTVESRYSEQYSKALSQLKAIEKLIKDQKIDDVKKGITWGMVAALDETNNMLDDVINFLK